MTGRRAVLQAACAWWAAAVACSDSQDEGLSLGFSLYGMPGIGIEEALGACAGIGYDSVELCLNPGYPTEPGRLTDADRRSLRRLLAQTGLEAPALMVNFRLLGDQQHRSRNLEGLREAAELGLDLAPEAPPLIETVLGGRPAEWEQVRDDMARELERWARAGEEARTTIAIKPHVSGALHTPEGALWLCRRVGSPWLRLVYDYSHYALRGLPMAETVEALIPESVYVHVKDAAGDPTQPRFLLPGDGDTDYRALLGLLWRRGYRGAVHVEASAQLHRQPGYDGIAAARRGYAVLTKAAAGAGVPRTKAAAGSRPLGY
jgi:sugar phosphate isomerase/epimerase